MTIDEVLAAFPKCAVDYCAEPARSRSLDRPNDDRCYQHAVPHCHNYDVPWLAAIEAVEKLREQQASAQGGGDVEAAGWALYEALNSTAERIDAARRRWVATLGTRQSPPPGGATTPGPYPDTRRVAATGRIGRIVEASSHAVLLRFEDGSQDWFNSIAVEPAEQPAGALTCECPEWLPGEPHIVTCPLRAAEQPAGAAESLGGALTAESNLRAKLADLHDAVFALWQSGWDSAAEIGRVKAAYARVKDADVAAAVWVHVEQAKPAEGEVCFIAQYGKATVFAVWTGKDWTKDHGECFGVTHWMRVPPGPYNDETTREQPQLRTMAGSEHLAREALTILKVTHTGFVSRIARMGLGEVAPPDWGQTIKVGAHVVCKVGIGTVSKERTVEGRRELFVSGSSWNFWIPENEAALRW